MKTTFTLPIEAQTWLRAGDLNPAVLMILEAHSGIPLVNVALRDPANPRCLPRSALELYHCHRMLERVPAYNRTFRKVMAEESVGWAPLIAQWGEVLDMLESETQAGNPLCPRTTGMLQLIILQQQEEKKR